VQQSVIEGFRLSPQQKRLWARPWERRGCRISGAIEVEGDAVSTSALAAAVSALLRRHEIFRTRFEQLAGMEIPLQVVAEEPAVELDRERLEDAEPGALEARVRALLDERQRRARDAETFAPGRLTVLEAGPGRWLVIVDLPALCADPQTLDHLVGELAEAWAAGAAERLEEPPEEPIEEPLQYVQFSEWQNELGETEESAAGLEFWSRLTAELPPIPTLGEERRESAEPGAEATVPVALAEGFTERAGAVAAELGTAPERIVLAAWQIVLARLGGVDRLLTHALFDGRKFPELEGGLGPFSRYLPLPLSIAADVPARRLIERLDHLVEEIDTWQEFYPEEDDPPADAGRVVFDALPWPAERDAAGARFRLLERRGAPAHAKLRSELRRRGGTFELSLHHDVKRFSAAAVARLGERLSTLLEGLLADPARPVGELPLLSAAERRRLLVDWNATGREFPAAASFHALVAERAEEMPDAAALVVADSVLSYGELRRRAGRWARRLAAAGLGRGGRAVLLFERSADQLLGVLATLEAGAAFVPIDPAQPASRLAAMLEESGATCALSEKRLAPLLAETRIPTLYLDRAPETPGEPAPPVPETVSETVPETVPEDLAYLIFTSGSTGRPKGVMVSHRSWVNLAHALGELYPSAGAARRVALNAPLSFDASIKQLAQWARGQTLVLVPEEVRPDGEAMLAFLERQRVEVLDCTPTQLRLLHGAGLSDQDSPGRILVGGEAISAELWRRLGAEPGRYTNVYGPTECTVDVTAWTIGAEPGEPTLGKPLANVRAYLLDARLEPVPQGVVGELCAGGAGIARGYAARPASTAERFVPDPFSAEPGARLYSSGDLARHRDDGAIVYLGRRDHQVKLRGFRVELGEIEAVLAEHPAVAEAVVALRDDGTRLVAYLTRRGSGQALPAGLGRFRLPNGLEVAHQNRNETEYLYEEIFDKRSYVLHGIRLPEDAVVFDVGANIGMFSLFIAQTRPRARIHAFEPLAPLYEVLRANAEAHLGSARLYPVGLAESPRRESFTFYPRYTMMSGRADFADAASEVEVIKRFLDNERRQGRGEEAAVLLEHADELLAGRFVAETHEVELRRLSDVIAETGVERIDLLKIDVQRAELDVLRGLAESDWRKVDQIVMEVHDAPGEASEGRVEILRELLEGHGFEVVVVQDELLVGTDRYNLYARRLDRLRGEEVGAAPALAQAAGLDVGELRELARSRLPEHMVPAVFAVLPELPVNRSGKVDRTALPDPEEVESAEAEETAEARTPFEAMLAEVWAQVLGLERWQVGPESNFFELGGHSLLATQLMSRLREVFGVELPLRTLFEAPTVEGLGARVEAALASGAGLEVPPIVPVPRTGEMPVSFGQRRLWFLDQLEPGSVAYNTSRVVELSGRLDVAALGRTLAEVVRRHEVLRSRFAARAGEPFQVIDPPAAVPLPVVDLAALAEPERAALSRELAGDEMARPFDLHSGPLLRALLLRSGPAEHVAALVLHHIVCDAWSIDVLVREVAVVYDAFSGGEPPPLDELEVQYADYAAWQQSWLRGEVLERELAYWRRQLAGELEVVELPSDRPPTPETVDRAGREVFFLPEELHAPLAELGRDAGVTLFMTLLAAFEVLLAHATGRRDLVVGVPIAGRHRIETEPLIGLFINMLALRTDLGGDPTFRELLERVRTTTLGAFTHRDVPFEKLVEELRPERKSARTPIFQVAFGLHNAPRESYRLSGLELRPLAVEHEAVRYDLTLWMMEAKDALAAAWTYNAALYDAATIEGFHRQLETVLRQAVANPELRLEQFDLKTAEEKAELDRKAVERKSKDRAKFLAKGRKKTAPAPVDEALGRKT